MDPALNGEARYDGGDADARADEVCGSDADPRLEQEGQVDEEDYHALLRDMAAEEAARAAVRQRARELAEEEERRDRMPLEERDCPICMAPLGEIGTYPIVQLPCGRVSRSIRRLPVK